MFGSQILEVAIGIIFIFLLVSIICSALREGIEAWLKTRAAYLEYGIRELLHDKGAIGLAKSFFNHPLIYCLFSKDYNPTDKTKPPGLLANGSNLPSYIPAKNFAQALMDIAARGPSTDIRSSDPNAPAVSLENIRINLLSLQNPAIQRVLLLAIDSAEGDLNKAQENLEAWYNSSMDRVSGWYKRSTSWVLFWIGLFVAVALNINTVSIATYLSKNDIARAAIVARAAALAKDSTFLQEDFQKVSQELSSLALPIGWDNIDITWPKKNSNFNLWDNVLSWILGWLVTGLAVTMGAPFWFDLLNKVMVIRSTVKPHEKSLEEASEDRQLPTQRIAGVIPEVEPKNLPAKPIKTSPLPIGEQPMINVQAPLDADSDVDGCLDHSHDALDEDITNDEDLPVATGGVEI
ncbi:hypothetical protein HNV11_14920 [Spirosoma taeanense]|uniref:Uncharacterized protein n=1 Tax=Spirosoma taeanense TaxID=2735870 RepID=A0A6M5YBF6_9BACT|nr:hypothetical protein [Spirosoma taeanense]QJW90581.1 hypothetical protein HNV11_14920 [Spirosoma taeanense]